MDLSTRVLAGISVAAAAIVALIALSGGIAAQSVEVQVLRNRGKATYEEQRFSDAAAAFAEVLRSAAVVAQDHLNLALAQYRNGDDAGTRETLDGAAELLVDHPGAAYLRGLVARRAADLQSAQAAFERARSLDPTDPAIRYNLGAVYAQLGEQEPALEEFAAVIAAGFDAGLQHYVSAVYQTLQSMLRDGRAEEAEPLVERYEQASRRLSPAARTANALEQSRWTVVVVPDSTLEPAQPDTARAVRLEPAALEVPAIGDVLVMDDVNLDGRQDWVLTGSSGGVWLSNVDEHVFHPLPTAAGVAALGDFDRDGMPDLYVAAGSGHELFRNVLADPEAAPGTAPFVATTATPAAAGGEPAAVVWGDYDHDGDLDILVIHEPEGSSGSAQLLQNLGAGEFSDTTTEAGLDGLRLAGGALWADLDSDYDVDLFAWGPAGTTLYSNQRGGAFGEIGPAVGAAVSAPVRHATAEDLDNDGRIDLVLATDAGVAVLRNVGDGAFLPVSPAGLDATGARSVAVADYNNDAYLDLVVMSDEGPTFFAGAGDLRFVRFEPLAGEALRPEPGTDGILASDLDGNGAIDLLVETGGGWTRFLQPAPVGRWLTVSPTGVKNNIRAIGTTVEVKTGGSYQVRPLRSAPLHFGIGDADTVDVVRLRWPNGIIQNLLDVDRDQLVEITELERLEGSCPFLYTWDGEGFHFVNEVLGAAPLGMLLAEGVYHHPDPDEYVLVPGERLRSMDGGLEIRVTEELRETVYLDAVRLLAVDHPASLTLLPDEGFGGSERPDLRVHLYEELLPVGARDHAGRDWTRALAEVDGEWAVPFEPAAFDGLASDHTLTLSLPEAGRARRNGGGRQPVSLYLTGWVYWSMGSVNLAVDQHPDAEFTPVSLQVPDGRGGWRTAIEDIGLPIAKNSTLVLDLGAIIDPEDPRIRLRTTMRLYWDAAGYTVGGAFGHGVQPTGDWKLSHGVPRTGPLSFATATGGDAPVRAHVLAPSTARLGARGFSTVTRTPEGFETFDYQRVVDTAPWEQHRGLYTAFGDVVELLEAADDRFIVFAAGDEVAIRFEDSLPAVPEGWRRDYLVYLHGWLKDSDLNTAYGDRVEPLPFHGMSGYPYSGDESYPDDPEHLEFLERYLTRTRRAINPPLVGHR